MVFETERLKIRRAKDSNGDVELYYRLWTDPKVMTQVGFPHGLKITREGIREGLKGAGDTVFERKLIVVQKETGRAIGECKLGKPNDEGISQTDIKLLPEFWGKGYGTEIKQGLVDYLFTHTDCTAVKATPNKNNIASQKMQEAVGGRKIKEDVFRFPEEMRGYTVDVHYYLYLVYRKDWEKIKKT